ncbi:MAG: hypothetical protein COB46_07965 [Rhodospirillaceae bacterium]|nr:MAG: hypothetical protein COB46_07965 [Rhodospirillaceae bacterium]
MKKNGEKGPKRIYCGPDPTILHCKTYIPAMQKLRFFFFSPAPKFFLEHDPVNFDLPKRQAHHQP